MSTFDKFSLLIIGVFGLVVLVLVLIPGLADAASRAVTALRDLWRAIKGQSATAPSPADEPGERP